MNNLSKILLGAGLAVMLAFFAARSRIHMEMTTETITQTMVTIIQTTGRTMALFTALMIGRFTEEGKFTETEMLMCTRTEE